MSQARMTCAAFELAQPGLFLVCESPFVSIPEHFVANYCYGWRKHEDEKAACEIEAARRRGDGGAHDSGARDQQPQIEAPPTPHQVVVERISHDEKDAHREGDAYRRREQ